MYNGKIRLIRVYDWMAHEVGDIVEVKDGRMNIFQKGNVNSTLYEGYTSFYDIKINWGGIFEEVKEGESKFNHNGVHVDVFYTSINNQGKLHVESNQGSKSNFISDLDTGDSVYFRSITDKEVDYGISIESAVEIRDYLNYLINIADESGYFKKKEKLDEIEELKRQIEIKRKELEEMDGE